MPYFLESHPTVISYETVEQPLKTAQITGNIQIGGVQTQFSPSGHMEDGLKYLLK